MSVASEGSQHGPDLEALARAVQAGDRAALEALCEATFRDVARILSRLGAGPGEIDDLTQSVMVQVCRSIHRFDGASTVRVWLYSVCARVYLHHRRTRGRFRRLLERLLGAGDAPSPPTPLDVARSREALARLDRRLAAMSPKLRAVFVLRELEGLSGAEVACALAIPLVTVRTRLHHARRVLLGEPGNEGDDD